jgi:hypothetical protein
VPSQFQGTLTIPPETTIVAAEIEPGAKKGPARIVILVSAGVIEPQSEKPVAGDRR